MNFHVLPRRVTKMAQELAPEAVELGRVRVLGQSPAPEVLDAENRCRTCAIALRSHEDSPATRPLILRMPYPNFSPRLRRIDSTVLGEGGERAPCFLGSWPVADLENRM